MDHDPHRIAPRLVLRDAHHAAAAVFHERHDRRSRYGLHAWHGSHAVHHVPDEPHADAALVTAAKLVEASEGERYRKHVLRFESGIDPGESHETVEQQPCTDQKNQRYREFTNDQGILQPQMTSAGAGLARGILHRVADVGLRGIDRRCYSEAYSGEDRRPESKTQDAKVDTDLVQPRHPIWNDQNEGVDTQVRHSKTNHPTHQRQHQAFGEQLRREPASTATHRRPNGKFPAAVGATGKQQIRHVGARDEQHQSHGAQQHEQWRPYVYSFRVTQWNQRNPANFPTGRDVGFRIRFRGELFPRRHLGTRILKRDALAQSTRNSYHVQTAAL